MYVRNVLNAGDFLTLVPIGVPITLQYSENGLIEKVYQGFENDRINISSQVSKLFAQHNTVPLKLSVKGGTSWVKGVLYTGERCNNEGKLPEAVCDSLIQKYIENPSKFNFFAGCVDSTSALFRGAYSCRQWLQMSGFKILPGFIIPANITDQLFYDMAMRNGYSFGSPYCATSYMIYRGSDVSFVSTNLRHVIVSDYNKYIDELGEHKVKIFNGDSDLVYDLSDFHYNNVSKGCCITIDDCNHIIECEYDDNTDKFSSNEIVCPVCGNKYTIPNSGPVICPDETCMSRHYSDMCHFLSTIGLPEIRYENYLNKILNKDITCLPDILLLDEYKDMKIELPINKLLRAIIPFSVVPNTSWIDKLANKCTNNINTLSYYLHHIDKLSTDLNLSGFELNNFTHWISVPGNLSDIDNIFDASNISVIETNKQFEGNPIFRNKLILITGDFLHGTVSDIQSILKSYSAEVTTDYSKDVSCVIVGSTMENINGTYLNKAKESNIPIFYENEFFNRFKIDEDLVENLE